MIKLICICILFWWNDSTWDTLQLVIVIFLLHFSTCYSISFLSVWVCGDQTSNKDKTSGLYIRFLEWKDDFSFEKMRVHNWTANSSFLAVNYKIFQICWFKYKCVVSNFIILIFWQRQWIVLFVFYVWHYGFIVLLLTWGLKPSFAERSCVCEWSVTRSICLNFDCFVACNIHIQEIH